MEPRQAQERGPPLAAREDAISFAHQPTPTTPPNISNHGQFAQIKASKQHSQTELTHLRLLRSHRTTWEKNSPKLGRPRTTSTTSTGRWRSTCPTPPSRTVRTSLAELGHRAALQDLSWEGRRSRKEDERRKVGLRGRAQGTTRERSFLVELGDDHHRSRSR